MTYMKVMPQHLGAEIEETALNISGYLAARLKLEEGSS
jgi:hypothetical protein